MFYKFNAHKASQPQTPETSDDKLAKKIAFKVQQFQLRWAGFMDRQTRKVPLKYLKAMLVTGVLGAGSFCAYLITKDAFASPASLYDTITLTKIWPSEQSERLQKYQIQSEFFRYVDSLENAIRQDSLANPEFYNWP